MFNELITSDRKNKFEAAKKARGLPSQTATEAYNEARQRIHQLMNQLSEDLSMLDCDQHLDPNNWGIVGDANRIAHDLETIISYS